MKRGGERGGARNKGKGEKRRGGKQRSSLWPGVGTRERGSRRFPTLRGKSGGTVDSFAPPNFSFASCFYFTFLYLPTSYCFPKQLFHVMKFTIVDEYLSNFLEIRRAEDRRERLKGDTRILEMENFLGGRETTPAQG